MGLLDGLFGGDQTVTQKVKYPSWYTNAAKDLIQFGNNAGSWYAQPYMGNTVAGLNDMQTGVIDRLGSQIGSTNAGYNTALAGTQASMNYQPQQVGGGFAPQQVQANQPGYNYNPSMVGNSFSPAQVSAGEQGYNYSPASISGGSFLDGNLSGYMDPFVSSVEQQAMGRLEDQRLRAQNSNADAAIRSGAFGGSRHGVVEGTTNAEAAKAAGELSANLRSQAYNNARGLQGQDLSRGFAAQQANQQAGMQNAQFGANIGLQNIANNLNAQQFNNQMGLSAAQLGQQAQLANQQAGLNNAQFGANFNLQNAANDLNAQQFNANMGYNAAQLGQQAQLANQQAGLAGAQLNQAGAAQYGQLTAAQQAAYLQSLQSALSGGNMLQQQDQLGLNQTADQYNAMRQYPVDLYNMRISALSGLQLPSTQTTGGGSGGLASGIMGGLGGALTGAGLFGTGGALAGLGGITAGGGAGLGAVLGLLGGLSDEREKTNIEKLGTDPETGLDIFAYDYKSDVKASKKNKTPMPMKRVGPMAQDIEAKYPGSTREIGGKMVVANLGFGA